MTEAPNRLVLNGAAGDLMVSREPEVLIEGPAGTGKTLACLTKCVANCEEVAGARVLIARATRVSMTQSLLVTLERTLITEKHHARKVSGAHRSGRTLYSFANGSEIVVGGLDNSERIMSTEYDLIYVAEATEITEEDWERLLTRLRNNRLHYQQAIADCNPGPPGHWLNQRAARGQMRRLLSRHCDNPSLTPEYLGVLSKLTGHRRARLYEGRWVAGEGSVYGADFIEARNVIDPFTIPSDWPMFVGWDPGYDHPTAILWFAVAPNGCLYVIDEIFEGGKSVAEHCRTIRRKNTGRTILRYYGDPQHAFSSTAQSPESIATQAKKHLGVGMVPWRKTGTQEEAMVNKVRERFQTSMLKFFRTCQNTINEHQSWMYKRTGKGELPPGEDAFEDKDNHTCDVVKGVIAMNLKFGLHQGVRIVVPP